MIIVHLLAALVGIEELQGVRRDVLPEDLRTPPGVVESEEHVPVKKQVSERNMEV